MLKLLSKSYTPVLHTSLALVWASLDELRCSSFARCWFSQPEEGVSRWPLFPLPHTSFSGKIDHRDHYLTTTHAKAREACAEKASRAFYMVFNLVHNRRKTAWNRLSPLCVWELRPDYYSQQDYCWLSFPQPLYSTSFKTFIPTFWSLLWSCEENGLLFHIFRTLEFLRRQYCLFFCNLTLLYLEYLLCAVYGNTNAAIHVCF